MQSVKNAPQPFKGGKVGGRSADGGGAQNSVSNAHNRTRINDLLAKCVYARMQFQEYVYCLCKISALCTASHFREIPGTLKLSHFQFAVSSAFLHTIILL